jgi:hypothetical protein
LVLIVMMAALGNLAAGVAHGVNTPLGICITMVSLNIERLKDLNQQVSQGVMTRTSLDTYMKETAEGQALVEGNLHRAAELIQRFKKVAVEQTADTFDNIVYRDNGNGMTAQGLEKMYAVRAV